MPGFTEIVAGGAQFAGDRHAQGRHIGLPLHGGAGGGGHVHNVHDEDERARRGPVARIVP